MDGVCVCVCVCVCGCMCVCVCVCERERERETDRQTDRIKAIDDDDDDMLVYTYVLIMIYRPIGRVGRVFANGPVEWGSIPGRVIPKTKKKKWYLISPCLTHIIIRCVSRVK